MMEHEPPANALPVLVVGAGPAGLTTSLLLARYGVRSVLVERHLGTSVLPRATGINIRTMEIFRLLGLADDISNQAMQFSGSSPLFLDMETLSGPTLNSVGFAVPLRSDDADSPSPVLGTQFGQDRLEPLLLQKLRTYRETDVRFGTELLGFEENNDMVTAELRDVSSGTRQQVRADYLVAADGANSGTRRRLGIAMNGHDHLGCELNILFRADLSQAIAGRRSVLYRVHNERISGIFRPVDNEARWCVTTPCFDDPSQERCVQAIRSGAGEPELCAEILSVQEWEMAAVLAERFRSGRVFLVGDAAHRVTPFGAFGMNTAIQDAHNLGWKLAAVIQGWAGQGLLDTYEPERLPVARQNVEFSFIPDMMRGDVRRASRTLNYVLGFSYDSSAVAPDGSAPPQVADTVADYVPCGRPGHRAPHCWVRVEGRKVSTIDLFDRDFVLLSRSESWRRVGHDVATELCVPMKSYVIDDPSWTQLYGVGPSGAVLVRPDGHVAWRRQRQDPDAAMDLRSAVVKILDLPGCLPDNSVVDTNF